ncbi:hypothetical protein [Dactylosporangium sp. NPDC048998]|uniref:hypothetical protein n=1 Tax=Dactylosporangium sp. NPDC048998 TaxID=3363976 RepID=UPI003715D26E
MSTYTSIFVDHKEVFSYRDEFRQEFRHLFARKEVHELVGPKASPYAVTCYPPEVLALSDPDQVYVVILKAAAEAIRDRLNVIGVGLDSVQRVFEEMRASEEGSARSTLHHLTEMGAISAEDEEAHRSTIEYYTDLKFDDWLDEVTEFVGGKLASHKVDYRNMGPMELISSMDAGTVLRTIVEVIPPGCEVAVDATGLKENGWLDDQDDSWPDYANFFGDRLVAPIILTEGTFDTQVISQSLAILKPHLVEYVRFLDFTIGNEGGAAAAVRMFKSFAAAGVVNRVLLLLDNDSAGREAALALRGVPLPKHYSVVHYPDIDVADAYPTVGPQGNSEMNVNGLAGSIELYLGKDVLRTDTGSLVPVQWKGYMGKVNAYQGEVMDKGRLQKAFREKAAAALSDEDAVQSQDWSGLNAILEVIVDTLSKPNL